MRYAFHFDDTVKTNVAFRWANEHDNPFFQALLKQESPWHILIRTGNINFWTDHDSIKRAFRKAKGIIGPGSPNTPMSEYVERLNHTDVYVLLVQGLTSRQAEDIANRLSKLEHFIVMLELDPSDTVHMVTYWFHLVQSYRIIGDELRLQHTGFEVATDDERDHGRMEYWQETSLWADVVWEDIGVRTTIFDEYDSPDHESIVGETESLLEDLLEGIANEVMLRAIDLDPRLVHALHAALSALRTAKTSEQRAQSALSCRRFLERLADVLYPPRDQKRDGRCLGPAQWRNRLWAYAEDALGDHAATRVDAQLKEIGDRIDAVANQANSRVHRPDIDQIGATRLVVALVSLTYDLALLSPPPEELPSEPYSPNINRLILDLLRDSDE